MANIFEGYNEGNAMFATIEYGSKLFFAGQGHNMFEIGGEGEYGSIMEIWVVFVREIEIGSSTAFGNLAQRDRCWCVWQESRHWLGTGWQHGGVWQHIFKELVAGLFKVFHFCLVGGQ